MTENSNIPRTGAAPAWPASRWTWACMLALALTLTTLAPSTQAAGAAPYDSLRIVSPRPDATMRDNKGDIRIVVRLSPPLQTDQGHRMTLSLDDRATAQMVGTEHLLKSVNRGTHTVQVQVTDGEGATVIQSDPVVFHLHQTSRQIPGAN